MKGLAVSYSRQDFDRLRYAFDAKLIKDGEPVSCELYACSALNGATMKLTNGDEYEHVAEACNIAGIILSVRRILTASRSNIGCEEFSPVLIQTLNTLREFIRSAMNEQGISPNHKQADLIVRLWANFFKHPGQVVSAHSCITQDERAFVDIVINTQKLSEWNDIIKNLPLNERDEKWKEILRDISGRSVYIEYPSIEELTNFFQGCAEHIDRLINRRKQKAERTN